MHAQLKRLPLSRQSDPAGLASTQWPPVLASFALSLKQVGNPHGHVADNWILQEVSIIDDLDRDHGCLFIGAQELCGRLPHGSVCVLAADRSMSWSGLVTQVDLDEWVEIARRGLAVVEIFSLVEDQSHYANIYKSRLVVFNRRNGKRCTCLRKLLDRPFAGFGNGDDGIEVDVESKFATLFTIL